MLHDSRREEMVLSIAPSIEFLLLAAARTVLLLFIVIGSL